MSDAGGAAPDGEDRALILRSLAGVWAGKCEVVTSRPRPELRWLDLAEGDEMPLDAAVAARAIALGISDLRIAASSFVFRYARALVFPAIVGLATLDVIPSLGLGNGRVAFPSAERGVLDVRDGYLTMVGPQGPDLPGVRVVAHRRALISSLVNEAIAGHLEMLVARLSNRFRIAPRVLFANVAYELCLEFVDPLLGSVSEQAVEDAFLFLELAGPILGRTGHLQLSTTEGALWLRFERASCCLVRLVPMRTSCDGCSDLELPARRRI
jgi:ferric iron reductase protein FhuF